jgi:hypothetical protein
MSRRSLIALKGERSLVAELAQLHDVESATAEGSGRRVRGKTANAIA